MSKSTSKCLWPILSQFSRNGIENDPFIIPFLIGVYYGNSKPISIEEYMEDFISEFTNISAGFEIQGILIKPILYYFLCDAPARQFLKCI